MFIRPDQVSLHDSLEGVLEVDVPCDAVAATVDVVFDGSIISDRSGDFEAAFGDDGRSVDDGSTRFP